MAINEELRNRRLCKCWRLRDVAMATGLSVSYLSNLERGRTEPSLKTLRKIAACYGMRLKISLERPSVAEVLEAAGYDLKAVNDD